MRRTQKYQKFWATPISSWDRTLSRIKPYSNNTHSSDLPKFCILYELLSNRSKYLNKETVLVSCAYPAKDPNLELCQGSGIYNFTTQWALQTLYCFGDWRRVIEYQHCKPDYEFYWLYVYLYAFNFTCLIYFSLGRKSVVLINSVSLLETSASSNLPLL
jgi:hypothetical protein